MAYSANADLTDSWVGQLASVLHQTERAIQPVPPGAARPRWGGRRGPGRGIWSLMDEVREYS